MYRQLFWASAALGRPFGGLRPRRIVHWLARRGFGRDRPDPAEFRWYKDPWGNEVLLHPHYFIDYQIIAFGAYDAPLSAFIQRSVQPGMCCLDVGSNIGLVAVNLARRVGPTGKVHCFEPLPHLLDRLRTHVERNQYQKIVRIHPLALSNKTGTALINMADDLLPNQGMASLVVAGHPDLQRHLEVQTVTLDEFSAAERVERIALIKMDVQGAEPLVLEGARETLKRDMPDLLMEVSPLDLASLGKTSRDLIAQLEGLDYRCYLLTNGGTVGAQMSASDTPKDLWVDNVYCRHRSRKEP